MRKQRLWAVFWLDSGKENSHDYDSVDRIRIIIFDSDRDTDLYHVENITRHKEISPLG